MDCLIQPTDLIRLWMHESQRVYGDKLTDDKDCDAFAKIQVDIVKKNFDVSSNGMFIFIIKYTHYFFMILYY